MSANGHFDVEAVKRHVDIERLIGRYDVQLKRSLTSPDQLMVIESHISMSSTPSVLNRYGFSHGSANDILTAAPGHCTMFGFEKRTCAVPADGSGRPVSVAV